MNRYADLRTRQQKEVNDFPMMFAFSNKQFEEGMRKLGLEPTDTDKIYSIGAGGFIRRSDSKAMHEMFDRHHAELDEAMKDEEFAYEAFLYEMDNHEYAINWDGDADVLSCFGLSEEELKERNLVGAYARARCTHMKKAEEWA